MQELWQKFTILILIYLIEMNNLISKLKCNENKYMIVLRTQLDLTITNQTPRLLRKAAIPGSTQWRAKNLTYPNPIQLQSATHGHTSLSMFQS